MDNAHVNIHVDKAKPLTSKFTDHLFFVFTGSIVFTQGYRFFSIQLLVESAEPISPCVSIAFGDIVF